MHLTHKKKQKIIGKRPPATAESEKNTTPPLTVEQRVDAVLHTSPRHFSADPSPTAKSKVFFVKNKRAPRTKSKPLLSFSEPTLNPKRLRIIHRRPHTGNLKPSKKPKRLNFIHRRPHTANLEPSKKPKRLNILHRRPHVADQEPTKKPKRLNIIHRRPHVASQEPSKKPKGLHAFGTRHTSDKKQTPKLKRHPAYSSQRAPTNATPWVPTPETAQPPPETNQTPPSPAQEQEHPRLRTRLFSHKDQATKKTRTTKTTTPQPKKHTPFTKTKPAEGTPPTAPTTSPTQTTPEAKGEEAKFPEYLPDINADEAKWIDQKVKETLTAGHTDTTPGTQPHPDKPTLDLPTPPTNTQTPQAPPASSYETSPNPSGAPAKRFEDLAPDGVVQFQEIAHRLKDQTLSHLGYTTGTIEEIDFYPLHEPYAYVEIVREQDSLDKRYLLVETQLTEDENNLLNFLKTTFFTLKFHPQDIGAVSEKDYLTKKVDEILADYMVPIEAESKKKIIYFLEKGFLGLDKLEILMKDSNIEDISCDGAGIPIFLYHRRYGSLQSNVEFTEEDQLTAFVVKLAQKCGKHISVAEPMLDATMPDGSRIQMTLSTEVTTKGSTFTIRKFSEDPFSPTDLVEFHTMSSEMVAFMWLAIENRINALIAGGTAAGKTSTLNALSLFIPRESKIVSIEETREINLPHPNWIPGVVRSGFGEVVGNKVIGEIDLYDLMKAALRQRPEYIIVGEIRGKEAYVLFQAMATGHTTYSTVHADSAQSLIHRLEGKPIEIPRIMLQALDLICIQVISRVKNKRARRCKQIIEIIDIDPTTKEILTNEVFRWDPIEDKFVYSGKSYILERIRSEKDISRETMIQEIKNRALLIEWMNKENYREFKKVATIIAQYADNPAETMKKVLGTT